MNLYLVMMLASDCGQYIFGAYPSVKTACEAKIRCEQFAAPWQSLAQDELREFSTLKMRTALTGKVKAVIGCVPINLCTVQQVGVGQDDAVEEVGCDDEGVVTLN